MINVHDASWFMIHHGATCSVLKMRLLMPVGISTQSLLSRNLSQKTHPRHDVQDRFATAWRIPNVSLWDWTLDLYNFTIHFGYFLHPRSEGTCIKFPQVSPVSLRGWIQRCHGSTSEGLTNTGWSVLNSALFLSNVSMSMSCPLIGPFILAWYTPYASLCRLYASYIYSYTHIYNHIYIHYPNGWLVMATGWTAMAHPWVHPIGDLLSPTSSSWAKMERLRTAAQSLVQNRKVTCILDLMFSLV